MMEEKVVEIIKKVTGYDNINIDTKIDLVEENILDSLAFIDLLNSLEEEFDIEIQPTLVNPNIWRNVRKIIEFVEYKTK